MDADIIKRIDEFIKTRTDFGDQRKKITNDMIKAGWYIKEHGGTWEDVQKFFTDELNVKVTLDAIQKRFKKNKNVRFSSLHEKNITQQDRMIRPKEEANTVADGSTSPQDNTPSLAVGLVINGIEYDRVEREYDSGDENIEKEIDMLEKKMESNGELNLNKIPKTIWKHYACRYEDDETVRVCIQEGAALDKVPTNARARYFARMFADSRAYIHLKRIS